MSAPCNTTAATVAAPGATGSYDVAPFDSIIVCVPFTVLVAPSSAANKYSVTTAYNAAVAAAVVYRVEAQTLYMDINKDYDSAEAIKVSPFTSPVACRSFRGVWTTDATSCLQQD